MPALTSGRYHIKWTRLADIPVPLYHAYVAVQHHKIYVTGCESPVEDTLNIKYVSMILTLTNGVSCHHQAITMVFLTSLVES